MILKPVVNHHTNFIYYILLMNHSYIIEKLNLEYYKMYWPITSTMSILEEYGVNMFTKHKTIEHNT
jgi:hypothetical protein